MVAIFFIILHALFLVSKRLAEVCDIISIEREHSYTTIAPLPEINNQLILFHKMINIHRITTLFSRIYL